MDFIDNLVAKRFGDLSFFSTSSRLYKFEKIKKVTNETRIRRPDITLIDMGVGEPDKGADKVLCDILNIESRRPENRFYADNGILEFQEAACKYLKKMYNLTGITVDNVMHGIGSKSILAMLPLAFINPGDVCLMTVPGYPILGTYSKFCGGEVYNLPLCPENDFFPNLDSIPEDILKRAKLLYLNYPNNPTGQVASKAFYEYVINFAKKNNIFIVSDLAYGPLVYDGYKPLSIMSIDGSMDVCVELHSLSKAFNMTGWRLAFIVGSKKMIKLFSTVKGHTDSGQFRAIQKAGAYALENPQLINENCERYSRRFNMLVEALREVGFNAKKPKSGFYVYVPIPIGVKNGVRFNDAEEASLYILSNALISTVPWDDCGSFLRFSTTFEANTIEDELYIINELKDRLTSLNLEF
ncbi:LL-diaminopimelate aminotransferase [Romboutsia weinsteinii]|uniref:Aminotransferase n=1 Tax=Romboutsia weinsteinii TaxID=2020949 RepID=A0A371J151_9FIRM|nr:LL-diaminopimelate aminotransferase [Romboutsia weinsteinii]RDY26521.1 LL-diaminopimelate aminotransferase [Romboutsia weinsteinii]